MSEIRTGRYVFDLAFDNQIQVAVVAHPSLLKYPKDLEVRSSKSHGDFSDQQTLWRCRLPF